LFALFAISGSTALELEIALLATKLAVYSIQSDADDVYFMTDLFI